MEMPTERSAPAVATGDAAMLPHFSGWELRMKTYAKLSRFNRNLLRDARNC